MSVENILKTLPDTNLSKNDLHNYYKLNNAIIFNSIVNAVKNGKLKAYRYYPDAKLSKEEFNSIFDYWDSTMEGNCEGALLPAPIRTTLSPDDIVEIRFKESMEFDTLSYRLIKRVSMVQFLKNKINVYGEIIGKVTLFNVKLNENNIPSKNNTIVWAEKSESFIPMKRDSLWDEEEWYQKYIMDKEVIYNSITKTGLIGKIKVFSNYPEEELNQKQFYNIINKWDSTNIDDDINNSNMQPDFIPTRSTYTFDDIVQIRFQEKIEFDTVSCVLTKEVNVLKFFVQNWNEYGKNVGLKKLYEVKLNN